MKKSLIFTGLLCGSAWISGCQSPMDDSLYQQWSRSQPQQVAQQITSSTALDTPAENALPTSATLGDLIVYGLAHNPAIDAARHRIEQAQQINPQVTSLDDPMFTVAPVGQMAQTADGEVSVMSSLSQKLPLGGKLATRGDIADQQVKMAQQQLRQTQLTVTRDLKQAYWNNHLAMQTLDVLHAQRKLMDQVYNSANATYQAGRSNQQDLLRITVEISQIDNRILTTTQQQQSAIARINALLNRPPAAPLTLHHTTDDVIDLLTLEDWQKQALYNAPQLQSIHIAIEQARKQLKLAHQQRIPDLTVMLNYSAVSDHGTSKAANGNDQIYAGLGINLPIWGEKLEAGERQAIARIRELLSQLIAENNQLQYNVADIFARVQSQQQQDTLYHDTILPQAQQVVDSALSQYQSGRGGFNELIDSWQKLLDLQLMSHRNHTLLQQDFAQLQYLAAIGQ